MYLSILLPVVLAALTVLAAYLSGYFNQERTRLTHEIADLKKEKDALATEKDALVQNADKLIAEKKTVLEDLLRQNVESLKLFKELEEYRDSHPEEFQIIRKPKPSPSPK